MVFVGGVVVVGEVVVVFKSAVKFAKEDEGSDALVVVAVSANDEVLSRAISTSTKFVVLSVVISELTCCGIVEYGELSGSELREAVNVTNGLVAFDSGVCALLCIPLLVIVFMFEVTLLVTVVELSFGASLVEMEVSEGAVL